MSLLAWIAEVTDSRGARRGERIQSLWSGYGELFRVQLDGGPQTSAVVKWARPPPAAQGSDSDARKRRSYQVETAFYRNVAPRCDETCRVPRLLGSLARDGEWVLVLEDLDAAGFEGRQRRIEGRSLDSCLAWLASFHARFLGERFEALWPSGTYWHLDTRRGELDAIDDPALREASARVDQLLEEACFTTLVHGDAKEANFCFGRGGHAAAAVDFQYVGGGSPMKDVAYLLHGRLDEPASHDAPEAHLDTYFRHLRGALARRDDVVEADAIELEARRLFPMARLDFCRFLAGWAPEHWRGDARSRAFVARALRDLC